MVKPVPAAPALEPLKYSKLGTGARFVSPATPSASADATFAVPSYVLADQVITTDEAALLIVKFLESLLLVWFESPAKLAVAVAVPAFVLLEYKTLSDWLSPPAPVTAAVHGVCADPLYVTLLGEQVTTVVDDAWLTVCVRGELLLSLKEPVCV